MPSSYMLGTQLEAFVKSQLSRGRYKNASEVVRHALRLMEERERRISALDAAVERGMNDIRAGRAKDANTVFERLEAKYALMADEPIPS